MADLTLSLLQLSDVLKDELIETGNHQCALLKVLPIVPATNPNAVNWAIDGYAGSSAFNFSEGGSLASYTTDTQYKPTLGYARYGAAKQITGSALRQAALTAAPSANVNLVALAMKGAMQDMTSSLGTDSFTGSGGNAIVGMETAIDVSTTYAGISRSSVAGFRATEVTAGNTALSIAHLRNLILNVAKRAGERPNLLVGSYNTLNKLMGLADSNFRVMFDSEVASRGLHLGFEYVSCLGVPFMADPNCPDGEIFAINTKWVQWEYVPAGNTLSSGYSMVQGFVDSVGDRLMLPFILKPIANSIDGLSFAIISELALVCRAPHKCGKLTDFI